MKSSFYFDHDYNASTDEKILSVRANFNNWEGYGMFFGILEHLCKNGGYLKREALATLSFGFSLPLATLERFIEYCIKIELLFEDDAIYSKRILEHLEYRKKLSDAGRLGGRGNKATLKPPLSQAKATPEAVKERIEEDSKEKDSKVKKKKVDKEPDFIDKIVDVFSRNYFESRGIEYRVNGSDRSAAGKLLMVVKKKYPLDDADTILKHFEDYFIMCLSLGGWYADNMSMSIINSKFNEINKILIHGEQRRNTGATNSELMEIAYSIGNNPG